MAVAVEVDGNDRGAVLGEVHLSANFARVIEAIVAYAKIDTETAVAGFAAAFDLAECAGDSNTMRFGDLVTEIVGRDRLRFQFRLGAGEFGLHGCQHG